MGAQYIVTGEWCCSCSPASHHDDGVSFNLIGDSLRDFSIRA